MAKKTEANIISYSILANAKGKIVSEYSIAEVDKLEGKLDIETLSTLKTIIRIAKEEFKKIHGRIERELDARVYKD
jgi:hypothetical protein